MSIKDIFTSLVGIGWADVGTEESTAYVVMRML